LLIRLRSFLDIPNDELKKDLLDIDNPNTTENFKPKNASEIWQFALNS
ncbi:hypothetical protein HMPREF1403_00009, partial [Helicobacter pylori GAM201Ai]